MNWHVLSEKALTLNGEALSYEEAHAILNAPNEELLPLLSAAWKVRFHYFGNRVKLNYLLNIKSGLCPEDCFYCSQSKLSKAPIPKYPLLDAEEIFKGVERACQAKAKRLCLVASGRGPTDREVEKIATLVEAVRKEFSYLEICCCLGLLSEKQAEILKSAGVYAYNHNLNTSQNFYGEICTTHTYQDRKATVLRVKSSGLSPCCGGLFGMGESNEDIVKLAFALREIQVDSIPINFLIPIPKTPLEGIWNLTPQKCLKILCLFRFLNPSSELRISGGREHHLGWLQPLGLYVANSIFIGDYLTAKGQAAADDLKMIKELGLVIEGDKDSQNVQREWKADEIPRFSIELKSPDSRG